MAKSKTPRYVTPAGIAVYPWLNTPDTKFNPEGEYRTKLTIKSEGNQDFLNFLNDLTEKSLEEAKQKNPGKKIKVGNEAYNENEDGTITLSFKLKAKVTPKSGDPFEQKVAIFDAKGKPTKAVVGGGSKIKVSFEAIPYYTAIAGAGVSLRVRAVQVLELKEYSKGGDGSSYGFGEEEGYVAQQEESTESSFTSDDDIEDF